MSFKNDFLNSTLTLKEVASRNNITKGMIPALVKQYNLPKVDRSKNASIGIIKALTKISETDKIEMIRLYKEEKLSTKEIAKKYDISTSSVNIYFKKYGVTIEQKFKYIANHDYFKNLTPKKARMLGLLATDGDIHQITGGNYRIRFSSNDLELINFIVEEIGGTYYVEEGGFRTYVMSKEIGEDLKRFGITQYKSYSLDVKFDLIPEDLRIYFLIGVIEGDGYVSKINPGQTAYINICTASEMFANQILDNYSKYFKYIYAKNCNKSNYLQILYYPQTTHTQRTLALTNEIILKSKDCGILNRKLERLNDIKNKYAKDPSFLL